MSTGNETTTSSFYKVRLGTGAAMRGERVICQLLGWAGANDSLARVRIVQSTLPHYRTGQIGLIQSQRLVPVRPRRAA